jgi:WD40 repeat protein
MIRIWDSETSEMVAGPFRGHKDWVTSVGFSPDGKYVISGSGDKTIRVWDSGTGEKVAGPFSGHTDLVTSVEFSPDGKRVVSGSRDKTLRIWDAETVESRFEGCIEGVAPLESSPNQKHVFLFPRNQIDPNAEHPSLFNHFVPYTGWIKTSDGHGLLFWVPTRNRGPIHSADTILIIGRGKVGVDLNSFVHGPHWMQCHHRPL